jgi:hypothetical protein
MALQVELELQQECQDRWAVEVSGTHHHEETGNR